ncbi:MAG: enoyl-CoA hydratase-related protein [Pseudomonadota bacterium]
MPAYTCFDLEIDGAIAHLRLNRPEKANSMIPEFWLELPAVVNDLSDNAKARVLVISSEGKHFSAGMDLSVFTQGALDADPDNPQLSAEAFRHNTTRLQDSFSALEKARMPVLCALQGGVIGGAVDMVTAADCRYASEDAYFVIQETALGMTADVGTYPRLCKLMPEGWVRQMSYTAEKLTAHKAKELGLVNDVYATADECLEATMEVAKRIAANSPLAITGAKRMINYARDHSTADALDYIVTWNAGMLRGEDIRESFMAKSEKRAPNYQDLRPLRSLAND